MRYTSFQVLVGIAFVLAILNLFFINKHERVPEYRLDSFGFKLHSLPEKKDPTTGFVVGGANSTALIRKLTKINGIAIADLERVMRPGESSTAGFLGPKESLLEVLAADNAFVVDDLGLTHRELGRHLHAMARIESSVGWNEFLYHGRRFRVTVQPWNDIQPSPFDDGTETCSDGVIYNLHTGKKLSFSLLVPYMIERYGFYEGKGTSYRVDPRDIVEVLDFLKEKVKKRP